MCINRDGTNMGRTNIVLDDGLVDRAMKLTGARSKREVVHLALQRLVEQADLFRAAALLRGELRWSGDLDGWRRSRS
jgi:Arc/MetJ family transcription regulator